MTGPVEPTRATLARSAQVRSGGVRSTGVVTRAALHMPRIRARIAELGLPTHGLDIRLGVTLSTLSGDPDHRTVSLTMLVRLSRLLDLPLDDLVVTNDPHPRPPRSAASHGTDGAGADPVGVDHAAPDLPGDDHLLLALVSTFNGLSVGRVLHLLAGVEPGTSGRRPGRHRRAPDAHRASRGGHRQQAAVHAAP